MLLLFFLLLPLRAAAQQVPVAARDLGRGAALTAEDIVWADGATAGDARGGAWAEPGWLTRRVVREGEPLRAPTVEPPALVRAGQTVHAVWSQGGLQVQLRGRALGSARQGERVVVRIDGRRRIEGIAVAPATVRVAGR